ncbi:MAG TPA: lipopolysaccharide biosynthesis protein [Candidatus Dormibacteraeota bacterium]|nr:lipopolysaccharide biosynthesis protein [Candidatus Dormibacteraeota bacterium]
MSTSAPAATRRKDDGLGKRTASAISLTFLTSTSGRVMTMITTFVLARLLTPHDFGIANLSSVLLAVVLPLTDIGIAQGLIRGAESTLSATARTAFWLVIALGAGLYVLGAGFSGVIAQFFGEPDLGPVLVVTNLSIVVYATSRIPSALLERELLYSRKVMPEVIGSIVYSVLAVGLALLSFGYWSIVIATLARSAVISAGLFVVTRWRPGISFDVKVARELISYARVLLASSMLRLAYTNVDNMIVGKVLGVTALGYYAMAYNLGNLLATQIAGAVGTGLFPAYSRMLPDKDRVRSAMLVILRYTGLVITPLTICGVITVPYLVPIVIGAKWLPMTTALQVILIYGWLRTVAPIYWTLMLVEDMRRDTLLINLVSLAVALAVAYPVVTNWGFVGIAIEFTLLEVVRTIWMALAIKFRLNAGLLSQMAQLWPGIAASAVVGLLLIAALRSPIGGSTLALLAEIAVAGALYLGLLVLFGQLGKKQLMMAGSVLQKRGG